MRVHVLGISGTFMSGIAMLAKANGVMVSGSDQQVYPPMSDQLKHAGILYQESYDLKGFDAEADEVIVGNVIRRGNPLLEHIMSKGYRYTSGPEWLARNVLHDKWVLAVSGTHGKTSTTSMVAWILECAGLSPGFLIGGVPENFGVSARLTDSQYFVIEADEYDSAFFDKRSKFLHYRPKTLILNNLEFDHADIFPDLDAIKKQFHILLRTVPQNGRVICYGRDANLDALLQMGVWAPVSRFGDAGADWQAELLEKDGSRFSVFYRSEYCGEVSWELLGLHNVNNALAAISAAYDVGVAPRVAVKALHEFKNVKRRLQVRGSVNGITVYDDFAHHPTAIQTTLQGLRAKIGAARLIAILEFGSYTMRTGVHRDRVEGCLQEADVVLIKRPADEQWGLSSVVKRFKKPAYLLDEVEDVLKTLAPLLKSNDHVVVMSNTGFQNIHERIVELSRTISI